jgi:hypothetical protein
MRAPRQWRNCRRLPQWAIRDPLDRSEFKPLPQRLASTASEQAVPPWVLYSLVIQDYATPSTLMSRFRDTYGNTRGVASCFVRNAH